MTCSALLSALANHAHCCSDAGPPETPFFNQLGQLASALPSTQQYSCVHPVCTLLVHTRPPLAAAHPTVWHDVIQVAGLAPVSECPEAQPAVTRTHTQHHFRLWPGVPVLCCTGIVISQLQRTTQQFCSVGARRGGIYWMATKQLELHGAVCWD